MNPLRVFIGYDSTQPAAYHVLAHSILRRASMPVSITPLALNQLKPAIYRRERTPFESTEFSMTRFLVPYLSDYWGTSIYMDCDMLCLTDLAQIWREMEGDKAVWCCQHDYEPKSGEKMHGAVQTRYPRKNWSSFIVFNNERCRVLTPRYVNNAPGTDLHRFAWLKDEEIGALSLDLNHLVGEYPQRDTARILHWTLGGPWLGGYENTDYAEIWRAERAHMLGSSSESPSKEAPCTSTAQRASASSMATP